MQSKIKICKVDFELILISHFLSLRKMCLTDFYFTLPNQSEFLIPEILRGRGRGVTRVDFEKNVI